MRAHLSRTRLHTAATALILAASLAAAPALAQTMGGLQSAWPLPAPQLAPTPAAGAPADGPAMAPAPRPLPVQGPLGVRDLDAAAPQNIRPPCNCPPPRHPTLEPTAVVMFRASPAAAAELVPPPVATAPVYALAPAQPPPVQLPPAQLPPAAPSYGAPAPATGLPDLAAPIQLATPQPFQTSGRVLTGDLQTPTFGQPREPRGPFTRIWQDSQRLVVHDAPEALANALPWVDRDRKDEPLDVVLDRVAGELSRANAADPEWALGAERELRALDARLQRLPEPPPAQPIVMVPPQPVPGGPDTRPFQPRPVWPGARVTSEPQRRPSALGSGTEQLDGPSAAGRGGGWAPPADLAPPAPPPPPPPPARTRRSRP